MDFDDIFQAGTQDDYENLKLVKGKIQMDDPVNIQFTSGTTGNPKGGNQKMDFPSWLILIKLSLSSSACLSNHNIVNNGRFIGHRLGYDKKVQFLFFHFFSFEKY